MIDDDSALVGFVILGLSCIGNPPPSEAGYWFEVQGGDSVWSEVKPIPAYVQYKD